MHGIETILPSAEAVSYLINLAAAVSVAGGVGLLAARARPRGSAPVRHGILVWALALILLSPAAVRLAQQNGLAIVRITIPGLPGANATLTANGELAADLPAALGSDETAVGVARPDEPGGHSAADGPHPSPLPAGEGTGVVRSAWWQMMGGIAAWLWAVGAAAALLRLGWGCVALARFCRRLDPLADPWRRLLVHQAADAVGLRRLPSVFFSRLGGVPVSIGLLRPAIVLPETMPREADEEQLQAILLHEMAHIARRDRWVGVGQRIATVLFWWNPLVHRVCDEISEVREEICDNHVVRVQGEGRRLARILVDLAAHVTHGPVLPSTIGVMEPRLAGLTGRVTRLLDKERNMETRMNLRSKVVLFACGLTVLSGMAAVGGLRLAYGQDAAESKPAAAGQTSPTSPGAPAATGTSNAGRGFPQDAKLTPIQRAMRDASEHQLAEYLNPSGWEDLSPQEKAVEEDRWVKQLSNESESARVLAIYALTALRSKKAVPALLQIAAERKEKDNRDRWLACRALGIIADRSAIPDLVSLTYHYNRDTRLWAQISLVRLTGENFGRDVTAWRQWWEKQGGTPPIAQESVAWATSPEMLTYANPKSMDQCDSWLLMQGAKRGQRNATGNPPQIVSTSPANGAKEVDPATTEVTVTFDRDMTPSFTWNGNGPDFPFMPESRAFWRDQRTCVLPVKLESGRNYRIGLNTFSPNYQSFRSLGGVLALPTTIRFSTRGERKADAATAVPPQPPKVEPNSQTVVEGVGWENFRLGMTREELIKAYGDPDPNPNSENQWVGWRSKYHVDCFFGRDGRAVEIRFNEGFNLPLTSGIKIGSTEKEVLSAYGIPDIVVQQPQQRMFAYGKPGVILWIEDGKVFDFTVDNHLAARFVGIGVALDKRDSRLMVQRVITDSPAESAGLQADDELLQVDGQPVNGDLDGAVSRIRGKADTIVKIKVRKKDGTEVELSIPRRPLHLP